MNTLLISAILSIILFFMFWRLCTNIGKIRDDLDTIAQYTIIKAEKEGIKTRT